MKLETVVYCISLIGADDGRTCISRQMRENDVDFEFIDAVDGNHLTDAQRARYDDKFRSKYHVKLTDREISCSLSHQKALAKFLESKYRYLILLEDDANLSYSLEKLMQFIEGFGNWDIIKLENRNAETPRFILKRSDAMSIFVPKTLTNGATGIRNYSPPKYGAGWVCRRNIWRFVCNTGQLNMYSNEKFDGLFRTLRK